MRKWLMLCLFVGCLLRGLAWPGITDSLLTAIALQDAPREQAMLYSKVAKSLQYQDLDSALWYGEKGLAIARKESYTLGLAENMAVLGDLYVVNNQLDEARDHYAQAAVLFKKEDQLFLYTQTQMVIANVLLAQDRYFDALQGYEQCMEISERENFEDLIPHLYNNMGVIYLDLDEYQASLPYFEKAEQAFLLQGDIYSQTLAATNLAIIYSKTGEEEKALNIYLELVPDFLKMEAWVNLASTYNAIASLYLGKKENSKAREYLSQALGILENNSLTTSGPSSMVKADVYSTAAFFYQQSQQPALSLSYARQSLSLAKANFFQQGLIDNTLLLSQSFESLGKMDSSLYYHKLYTQYWESLKKDEINKQISQQKMRHEFEGRLQEAELLRLKQEVDLQRRAYLYLGLALLALLSVVILVLLYINQKNKATKAMLRKENLELEREKLNQDIEYKNKELTTNMMYLFEKNEFITHIARKLDEIKSEVKRDNKVLIQQIINELKNNTSKKTWEEFELRFMEVHADFYEALNDAYPELSPNEKKLCAFLRLNMTTKEISAITHQSVKSINMARFRLRKKMNMERDENLISFLAHL